MSPKKIRKLADKKYRTETGLFIVEGEKNIRELFTASLVITDIIGTSTFLQSLGETIQRYESVQTNTIFLQEVSEQTLIETGTLRSNNAGIAVVKQPQVLSLEEVLTFATTSLVLVLDDIRDPGNLGTIIRIADWYNIKHIIASASTVDHYNPKVVHATMGSFTRINLTYTENSDWLSYIDTTCTPLIVADMHGTNVHTTILPTHGFLVMGSESHGIHDTHILDCASHICTIPRLGHAESLNVSVATGILLDNIYRHR
jgi:RNA methyltransferase, TrmH family